MGSPEIALSTLQASQKNLTFFERDSLFDATKENRC
ncbi:hypothetical protein Ple7327_2781 [Pleurocapsa sp. PCC 7327]|nr:hypothetical protein Ple7327_2781 [Pleurocapsa sp. PCC 7327]